MRGKSKQTNYSLEQKSILSDNILSGRTIRYLASLDALHQWSEESLNFIAFA